MTAEEFQAITQIGQNLLFMGIAGALVVFYAVVCCGLPIALMGFLCAVGAKSARLVEMVIFRRLWRKWRRRPTLVIQGLRPGSLKR